MSSQSARRVTIVVRHAQTPPGYHEVVRLLRDHGARNVFAIHPVESVVDSGEPATVTADVAAFIYWFDTHERVARVLPLVRAHVPNCLAVVEEVAIAFDTAAAVPDLPRSVIVADVMTRDPVEVEAGDPLSDVVYIMVRRNLRAIPVIDAERRVVGIITNSDLVARAGLPLRVELLQGLSTADQQEAIDGLATGPQTAGAVMTSAVVTVTPETSVREAARLMVQRRLKRLPVVDEQDHLVGVVSRFDLLRSVSWLPEEPVEPAFPAAATSPDMPVREVMSSTVPVVGPGANLAEVLSAVVSTRLHRVIVVDEDRHVLGIISDADLVERLTPEVRPTALSVLMHHLPGTHASAGFEERVRHTRGHVASELMQLRPLVVHAGDAIGSVIDPILRSGSKAVPVVDEEEKLVGVLDRAHLLWAVLGTGR